MTINIFDFDFAVLDVNDESVVFERPIYHARVSEAAPRGHFISKVSAYDPDIMDSLRFAIIGQSHHYGTAFEIDEKSGLSRSIPYIFLPFFLYKTRQERFLLFLFSSTKRYDMFCRVIYPFPVWFAWWFWFGNPFLQLIDCPPQNIIVKQENCLPLTFLLTFELLFI